MSKTKSSHYITVKMDALGQAVNAAHILLRRLDEEDEHGHGNHTEDEHHHDEEAVHAAEKAAKDKTALQLRDAKIGLIAGVGVYISAKCLQFIHLLRNRLRACAINASIRPQLVVLCALQASSLWRSRCCRTS